MKLEQTANPDQERRELVLIDNAPFYYATFISNGNRVRRMLTQAEYKYALGLLKGSDCNGIDSFCYRIV